MSNKRICSGCSSEGSSTIWHNHHILPKRLGGTDESSNLRILCPTCHSEAHFLLYLEYSDPRDYLAARALAGMVGKEEMISELREIGLAKAQPLGLAKIKDLWEDPEWASRRMAQLVELWKRAGRKNKDLWNSDESHREKKLKQLEEARKNISEEGRERATATLLGKAQDARREKRERDQEWREREAEHCRKMASKGGEAAAKKYREDPEFREKVARTTKALNTTKFICTVTGHISTAGPLSRYQKARGIDPINRRRYDEN